MTELTRKVNFMVMYDYAPEKSTHATDHFMRKTTFLDIDGYSNLSNGNFRISNL